MVVLTKASYLGRRLFVLRDDLRCALPSLPLVRGNKPRKFQFLLQSNSGPPTIARSSSWVHVLDKLVGFKTNIKVDELTLANSCSSSSSESGSGDGGTSVKLHAINTIDNFDVIVSHGGLQSNSMLALSEICRHYQREFVYLVKDSTFNLPTQTGDNSVLDVKDDNYSIAINHGLKLERVSDEVYSSLCIRPSSSGSGYEHVDNLLKSLLPQYADKRVLFVPAGGYSGSAEIGIKSLARDVLDALASQQGQTEKEYKRWKVIVASGTGTTALFLARALAFAKKGDSSDKNHPLPLLSELDIEVVAAPCVGNEGYLMEQMEHLDSVSGGFKIFPNILHSSKLTRRVFAKPYAEHLKMWREVSSETGINTFDLIYAPRAFELLQGNSYVPKGNGTGNGEIARSSPYHGVSLLSDPEYQDTGLLYYHCGGAEGNISQLQRYERKFKKKKI